MAITTYTIGKVMIDANDLGEVTSASLNISLDAGETTAIGDVWKKQIGLGKSWNLSASFNYDPANLAQAALRTEFISGDGDIASVKMYEDATKYFEGAGVITSFSVSKNINAVDTVSVTIEGNGALTYN